MMQYTEQAKVNVRMQESECRTREWEMNNQMCPSQTLPSRGVTEQVGRRRRDYGMEKQIGCSPGAESCSDQKRSQQAFGMEQEYIIVDDLWISLWRI
jgi:hypothetical protein